MTVAELLAMLCPMPLTAEVLIAFEDEGCLTPYLCQVEYDHGDDTPFVRLYINRDEKEMTWQEQLRNEA